MKKKKKKRKREKRDNIFLEFYDKNNAGNINLRGAVRVGCRV
jgi:hypothetical protein